MKITILINANVEIKKEMLFQKHHFITKDEVWILSPYHRFPQS